MRKNKKLIQIVFVLIFSSFAFANINTNATILNSSKKNKTIKQKDIKTLKDYNDFITSMKEGISLGNYDMAIALGALYMQDIDLIDGVKKANLSLAKKYFKLAYSKGYGFAAFYLSMIEDKEQAINDLKNALFMEHTTEPIRELLAIRYSELILNTSLYKNKRLVEIAIKNIAPISYHSDNPTLDFQLAHLYFINKQIKLANKFINSACNNPKSDKKLLAMCINDPYLQTRDKNGNLINKTSVIQDTTTPFNSACMQKYHYGKRQ